MTEMASDIQKEHALLANGIVRNMFELLASPGEGDYDDAYLNPANQAFDYVCLQLNAVVAVQYDGSEYHVRVNDSDTIFEYIADNEAWAVLTVDEIPDKYWRITAFGAEEGNEWYIDYVTEVFPHAVVRIEFRTAPVCSY